MGLSKGSVMTSEKTGRLSLIMYDVKFVLVVYSRIVRELVMLPAKSKYSLNTSALFVERSSGTGNPLPERPGKLPEGSGAPMPLPSSMSDPIPVVRAVLLKSATLSWAALDVILNSLEKLIIRQLTETAPPVIPAPRYSGDVRRIPT